MMFEDTSTRKDFTTKQAFLFYSFTLDKEEKENWAHFYLFWTKSGIAELIRERLPKEWQEPPSNDSFKLFVAILPWAHRA